MRRGGGAPTGGERPGRNDYPIVTGWYLSPPIRDMADGPSFKNFRFGVKIVKPHVSLISYLPISQH